MKSRKNGEEDYRNFADRFLSNGMTIDPLIRGADSLEDIAVIQAELKERGIDDYRLDMTRRRAKELETRS